MKFGQLFDYRLMQLTAFYSAFLANFFYDMGYFFNAMDNIFQVRWHQETTLNHAFTPAENMSLA